MREDYTLLTPENVELRYDVAGVGSRLVAATLDYTLIGFAYLAFTLASAFVVGMLREAFPRTLGATSQYAAFFGFATVAVSILLTFFGWWGYFILFEVSWNG